MTKLTKFGHTVLLTSQGSVSFEFSLAGGGSVGGGGRGWFESHAKS